MPKELDKLIPRNQLPPQSVIIPVFENAPDVLGSVFGFVHEVPSSVDEGDGRTRISGQAHSID
ncbi:MAG: hypothetical protein ACYS6K_29440 [Planctomycetota bacterium]